MECAPSSTFLCVASSTSKAGTTCPAVRVSILIAPAVVLSRRSAMKRKLSQAVTVLGQEACIFSVRAGCPKAGAASAAAITPMDANSTSVFTPSSFTNGLLPESSRHRKAGVILRGEAAFGLDAEALEHSNDLARVLCAVPYGTLEH